MAMKLKYLDELSDERIVGKTVFLRGDLNVPLSGGTITDETRLTRLMPTIRYLMDKKAKIVLASHLGRPKGKPDTKFTLLPVAERLAELTDTKVVFADDCVGDPIKEMIKMLGPCEIFVLENLRFHKEEEANEEGFARELASLADVYVDDAFGAVHRANASIEKIVDFMKIAVGGFILRDEINFLSAVIESPKRPLVAILGGSKVSDKIGVIGSLIDKVDRLVIGGAMAYTFLKSQGVEVGSSRVEEDFVSKAKQYLDTAFKQRVEIVLPVDHVIAGEISETATVGTTESSAIPVGFMGVDIGPRSVRLYKEKMADAKTVFWNGPLGVFEIAKMANGTMEMAKYIATLDAVTVVGGGDSVSAVNKSGVSDKISHISTGGGASLEFLEGLRLPGIEALIKKNK